MVEILGGAAGQAAASWQAAAAGTASHSRALGLTVLLVGGFLAGLAGLAWLQQRLPRLLAWRPRRRRPQADEHPAAAPVELGAAQELALTIAGGIGLHNLSEGLAVGQSAAAGRTALAVGLVIGFALHNSTEGFAILGPLVGAGERVPWRRIGLYGLIGGGPTFVGVALGGLWTSQALDVAVLALAGGALLYVIGQILGGLRRQAAQVAVMTFLAGGFALGWGTGVVAAVALAGTGGAGAGTAAGCTAQTTSADGDLVAGTCTATAVPQPAMSPVTAAAQNRAADAVLHEQALTPAVEPDGTRHYTLTASAFPWQLYPGRVVTAWGYNGTVPGPLLRWRVGDKVAVTLVNHLRQPTSLHWHGLGVPQAADGDPMTGTDVAPGASHTYRFTVTAQMLGTHWYHSHVNIDYQVDAGLHGPLIIDPAPRGSSAAAAARPDVDALVTLSAFKVTGSEVENVFTIDGKAYPLAPRLTVRQGQRLLLRLINDSAEDTHVMHLHGYTWTQVATDGNPVPAGADSNNLTLGPGETADMLVVATRPGTWMLQCHVLDHTINPGRGDGSATTMADMGGLITYLQVIPT
jgi:FtsP/CotA-like multicopper oxidase with cupredoxin domain